MTIQKLNSGRKRSCCGQISHIENDVQSARAGRQKQLPRPGSGCYRTGILKSNHFCIWHSFCVSSNRSIRATQSAMSDLLDISEESPSPLLGLLLPGSSIHKESSHETSDGNSACCGTGRCDGRRGNRPRSLQSDRPAASGPDFLSVASRAADGSRPTGTGDRCGCCSELLVRTWFRSCCTDIGRLLLPDELRLQRGYCSGNRFREHCEELLVRTGNCSGCSCGTDDDSPIRQSRSRTPLEEAAFCSSLIVRSDPDAGCRTPVSGFFLRSVIVRDDQRAASREHRLERQTGREHPDLDRRQTVGQVDPEDSRRRSRFATFQRSTGTVLLQRIRPRCDPRLSRSRICLRFARRRLRGNQRTENAAIAADRPGENTVTTSRVPPGARAALLLPGRFRRHSDSVVRRACIQCPPKFGWSTRRFPASKDVSCAVETKQSQICVC